MDQTQSTAAARVEQSLFLFVEMLVDLQASIDAMAKTFCEIDAAVKGRDPAASYEDYKQRVTEKKRDLLLTVSERLPDVSATSQKGIRRDGPNRNQ